MMSRAAHLSAAILAALVLSFAGSARASWTQGGVQLKAPPERVVSPASIPDGQGGVFAVWRETDGDVPGIYVNRVTGSGDLPGGWSVGGKLLAAAQPPYDSYYLPLSVVGDGSGGLFVAFTSGPNALVQHADAQGQIVTGWPAAGLALGAGHRPRISTDGAGGAYVAWSNGGIPTVQRVTAVGAVASGWPAGGLALGTGAYTIDVTRAGTNGVYVVWDGVVQRVTDAGTTDPAWNSGVSVPGSHWVRAVADGADGVVVSYGDNGGPGYNLRATRLRSDATFAPGWSQSGVAVASSIDMSLGFYDHHTMVSDGAGGAFLAYVSTITGYAVKVHHVLGSGSLATGWGSEGVPVSAFEYSLKAAPTLIADGGGGAVLSWQEIRDGSCLYDPNINYCNWDVYAGRVRADGTVDPSFPANGQAIAALGGIQQTPSIALAGPNQGIVVWQDGRPSLYNWEESVYAQQVVFDAIPPAQTTNLSAGTTRYSALVMWTASGDDGMSGTAQSVDLRYSLNPINNEYDFAVAWHGPTVTPLPGGSSQCEEISGLAPCTWYYFALKTIDDAGNASPISNVVHVRTKCSGSIMLTCLDNGIEGLGAGLAQVGLAAPSPNPANDLVAFRYAAPAEESGSPYELSVYDLTGRRVRVIDAGPGAAGMHELAWHPREDGGLEPGVYFVRFRAGRFLQKRTLIILGQR